MDSSKGPSMKYTLGSLLPALCIAIFAAGCAATPQRIASADSYAGSATGFLDKSVLVDDKVARYALYVPENYTPDKPWPLIVFLHGSGERGDDNLLQTEVGIGSAIRRNRDWFPALVLMPQCPEDRFWDAAVPAIEAALVQTRATYHVDDRAITLTGLSLGGYGTWIWGGLNVDTFAALMPVCGGGDPADLGKRLLKSSKGRLGTMDERVQNLAKVPIWAFHGAEDDVVAPERSRAMVERVQAAGGKVRYTEFPKTGHNSWDAAYGQREHIQWLLKQRRP